jgi:hypothetical protein
MRKSRNREAAIGAIQAEILESSHLEDKWCTAMDKAKATGLISPEEVDDE